MDEKRRIQVLVSEDTWSRLKVIADKNGVTRSALIGRWINEKLDSLDMVELMKQKMKDPRFFEIVFGKAVEGLKEYNDGQMTIDDYLSKKEGSD